MLSIFSDAIMNATRCDKWCAPDHWGTERQVHGRDHRQRDAIHRRERLPRDAGLW